MVSVPRLLIIGERGYCRSDAHWLEQLSCILSILKKYPTVALQIRNKYAPKSWNIVESHIDRWMYSHTNQCLLNGWTFPMVHCSRHIPEAQLDTDPVNPMVLCGGSVHSVAALDEAIRFGCHYVQYGAVFRTSKPVIPTGVEALQTICSTSPLPVLAVGGISNAQKIYSCLSAGAYGISIGSWIMQSKQPTSVIDHIFEEISQFMPNL